MDLESIQYFVIVCEEKKISEAAEKLFMSKQALSSIIRKMEEEVGVPLLVRSRNGVEMTKEGEIFFKHACSILSMWEKTLVEINQARTRTKNRLRVEFNHATIYLWKKHHEIRFASLYPDIVLETDAKCTSQMISDMDEGYADLLITTSLPDKVDRQYTEYLLKQLGCNVLIPAGNPLAREECLAPQMLAGHKVFFTSSEKEYMHRLGSYMKSRRIDFDAELLPGSNSFSNLRRVYEEDGLLISNRIYKLLVPEYRDYVSRDLVCTEGEELPEEGLYAVMLRENENNPRIKSFIEYFQSTLHGLDI